MCKKLITFDHKIKSDVGLQQEHRPDWSFGDVIILPVLYIALIALPVLLIIAAGKLDGH